MVQRPAFDLNLMRVFMAVVREGSTVNAAVRLALTQSAVSHALRRLREQFRDPLFTRSPHGLSPTPRALELAAAIEPILRRIDEDVLPERTFDPQSAEWEIRIAVSDVGELSVMPGIFEAIRLEAPRCTVRTISASSSECYRQMVDNELDLMITGTAPHGPELHRQWLFNDRFVVIGHRDRLGDQIDLKTYLERKHIAVSLPGKRVTIVDEALAKIGRTRTIALWSEHYLALPYVLRRAPDLLATVPSGVLSAITEFPELRSTKLPFVMDEVEILQLWHGANNRAPSHRWLRNLIKRSTWSSSEEDVATKSWSSAVEPIDGENEVAS